MPKTILLIESDSPFAREMADALEARGFGVRVSGDGKEGLELARDLRPDAVVLCVELPRMSGYSVCNKLKKDEALRSIPLVVISAEATPETFEQHRKLKTRAEDYLIKPFPADTLVERVGALVGLPVAPHVAEEEVVTLADVELEGGAVREIPPMAFSGNPEGDVDEDLRLLDHAFDSISRADAAPHAPVPERAAAPHAPVEDRAVVPHPLAAEHAGVAHAPAADHAAAPFVADEEVVEAPPRLAARPPAEPELEAVPELEPELVTADADEPFAPLAEVPPPTPAPTVRAPAAAVAPPAPLSTEALLREAGIPLLAAEPPAGPRGGDDADEARTELDTTRAALQERGAETRALREEVARLRAAAEEAVPAASARESELRAARARLEAVQGTVRKLEADLHAAREDARLAAERAAGLDRDLAALRARLEESEQLASRRGAEIAEAVARAESAGRSADELRTEVSVLRAEADGIRSEAERRSADLRRRLSELESQGARHEERVVKAYQKIKGDERLKEKIRKALGVALQLLDERLPPEGGTEAGAPPPERPAS
jgi:CheY-like chemotaxis protein